MVKCLLIFFLLLSSSVTANESRAGIIAEIDSILDVVEAQRYGADIESAVKNSYLALSMSQDIDYSHGIIEAYTTLAQTLFYLGEYTKSLEYLDLIEEENKSLDSEPLTLFEISRIRGQIFYYINLYRKSIEEFNKCIELSKQIEPRQNSDYCLSLTYENLSFVYNGINKPDSAFYYMNLNRDLLESMDESFTFRNLINLYTTIGNLHSISGDFELAETNFDNALQLAEKYRYPYLSRTYMFLGDMQIKKESTDSALIYYNYALDNLETTKIRGEYKLIYERISEIYQKAGLTDSAKVYWQKQNEIENVLNQERENSVERALQVFINQEKKIQANKNRKLITIVSVSVLLLIFVVIAIWRILRKRMLDKKEQEALILKNKLDLSIKEIEKKKEQTKLLEKRLNDSLDEIMELAKANDVMFLKRFQEVYHDKTERLLRKHPDLTNTDLTLCAMIFLNFSSKEIANYTFVEHRTVQTKKNRLRKKLNLPAGYSLELYLNSFN